MGQNENTELVVIMSINLKFTMSWKQFVLSALGELIWQNGAIMFRLLEEIKPWILPPLRGMDLPDNIDSC